jgi:hypothetical protein
MKEAGRKSLQLVFSLSEYQGGIKAHVRPLKLPSGCATRLLVPPPPKKSWYTISRSLLPMRPWGDLVPHTSLGSDCLVGYLHYSVTLRLHSDSYSSHYYNIAHI